MDKKAFHLYIDGAYRDNSISVGIVVYNPIEDKVIFHKGLNITDNIEYKDLKISSELAEVSSVIIGLNVCSQLNIKNVKIFYDYYNIYDYLVFEENKTKLIEYYKNSYKQIREKFDYIEFIKCKAHNDVKYNMLADTIARRSL